MYTMYGSFLRSEFLDGNMEPVSHDGQRGARVPGIFGMRARGNQILYMTAGTRTNRNANFASLLRNFHVACKWQIKTLPV